MPAANSIDELLERMVEANASDLHVIGSSVLVQTLLEHDLVDELVLMMFPITLGSGKRLFGEGTMPAAFKMTDSLVTKNGVIFTIYERAGDVETGTVGA